MIRSQRTHPVVRRLRSLTAALAVALAAPPVAAAEDPRVELLDRVVQLREANYTLDEAAATRLAGELAALAEDPAFPLRAEAWYQAGTAHALLAGFVAPGSVAHPQGDRDRFLAASAAATAAYEAAVTIDPEHADALAALANNLGMSGARESDPARRQATLERAREARARSLELAPKRPRVVLGHAGQLFWSPHAAGGDRVRGLARYREALELFAAEPEAERARHAWGEPDGWAFLAFVSLLLEPPDVAGARAAIDRALALRADFGWARRALLPRVEAAEAKAAAPTQ